MHHLTANDHTDRRSGPLPDTPSAGLRVEPVDPSKDEAWDRLLSAHPGSTLFHTSAWAKVLAETYGHRPCFLRLLKGRELLALIPMAEVRSIVTGTRGVCMPFADFCGPLLFGNCELADLLPFLHRYARGRKWSHFELRCDSPASPEPPPPRRLYHHRLDLREGEGAVTARLARSVQRALERSFATGSDAEISRDWPAMKAFYRLHAVTRRRHGLPPQPLSFFKRIHEHIVAVGNGFLVLVKVAGHPASALLFFTHRRSAVYKAGASDTRFLPGRVNHRALWSGIQHLLRSGIEQLSFGRTDLGHEGLRRFKRGWGTTEELVGYHRFDPVRECPIQATAPGGAGFHQSIFRHLPIPVNRIAGAVLYPHLD